MWTTDGSKHKVASATSAWSGFPDRPRPPTHVTGTGPCHLALLVGDPTQAVPLPSWTSLQSWPYLTDKELSLFNALSTVTIPVLMVWHGWCPHMTDEETAGRLRRPGSPHTSSEGRAGSQALAFPLLPPSTGAPAGQREGTWGWRGQRVEPRPVGETGQGTWPQAAALLTCHPASSWTEPSTRVRGGDGCS